MDMYFKDSVDKDAFMLWLKSIRERLTPPGETLLSYHDLMLSMFDVVERQATQVTTAAGTTSMLRSNGKCWLYFYFSLADSIVCSRPLVLFLFLSLLPYTLQASTLVMSLLTIHAFLSPRGIPSVTL